MPFFSVLGTIEPGRSLLQFVTTNCLKNTKFYIFVVGASSLFSLEFPDTPNLMVRFALSHHSLTFKGCDFVKHNCESIKNYCSEISV